MPKTIDNLSRALAIGAAVIALLAPAAHAGKRQETILRDDAALAGWDDSLRQRALADVDALGVDTIHHIVGWRSIAPDSEDRDRPKFDASDPAAYDPAEWDRID